MRPPCGTRALRVAFWLLAIGLGLGPHAVCRAQTDTLKAYLFIAVETDTTRPYYWASKGQTRTDELRRLFQERLESFPLELKVVTHAKQADLARALNDGRTAAVFWVGHSNKGSSAAFGAQDIVTDADGNNVAPLFQKLHSNLRWLAIIGCRAEHILEKYRKHGYYKKNKILRTYAYSTVVEESVGLAQATFASYLYMGAMLRAYPNYVCDRSTPPAQKLILTRTVAQGLQGSEFQVFVDEHLVAVVPKTPPSQAHAQIQMQTLWIDESIAPLEKPFNVRLQAAGEPVYGDIILQDDEHHASHHVVRKRDGAPMGQTQRVFVPVKGLTLSPVQARPSECQADQNLF